MSAARRDQRVRLWLALAAVVTVAAGLATRAGPSPLPGIVREYAVDTLWAALVFLLLAIALPRRPAPFLAAVALAIAFGVELSQLYRAPWLDAIRDSLPGRLILGQGFLFSDLLCYTFGVAAAATIYQLACGRGMRGVPVILGGAVCVTLIVAVVASNLGHGPQLFGFLDRVPGKDKTGHFLLMGALSFFVVLMVAPRLKMGAGKACAVVVLALCAVVTLEEFSQAFISTRSFTVSDLLCSLAGVMVFGATAFLFVRR